VKEYGEAKNAPPPVTGVTGSVVAAYGSYTPKVVCRPMCVTDVILQPGKRVIFLFIFGIGALLCLVTAQARFNRINPSPEGEKDYHAPRQEGFAELAAGMRGDRRKPAEKPERTERRIPEEARREPEKAPEKPARTLIIRTAERPVSPPRYHSNNDDAQAASTLRTLKLQALAAKPLVEDFNPKEDDGGRASLRIDGLSSGIANTSSGGAAIDAAAMAAITQQGGAPDANMQARKMDFLRTEGGSLTPQGYSENLPRARRGHNRHGREAG
jgi:hypothetical protein